MAMIARPTLETRGWQQNSLAAIPAPCFIMKLTAVGASGVFAGGTGTNSQGLGHSRRSSRRRSTGKWTVIGENDVILA